MNCQIVRNVVQEYLEGRLAALDRNEFVHHVDQCKSCEDEVLAYRAVFTDLRRMGRFEAPSGLETVVMAELREQGLVREKKIPLLSRLLDGFLALPAFARYPLAAAGVIIALYAPVTLVLGRFREAVGIATGMIADGYLFAQNALGSISAVARVCETLASYAKAQALASLASQGIIMSLGVGFLAALLITIRWFGRKRSSHNAHYLV